MRDHHCARARTIQLAATLVSASIVLGCVDSTRATEIPAQSQGAEAAFIASAASSNCAKAPVRGRSYGTTQPTTPLDLSVALGDTVRLARFLQLRGVGGATTTVAWRADDSTVAHLEQDLVLPLAPGRTWVTGTVAGRSICIALTTLFTGVRPSALTVLASAAPIAGDTATRIAATLRYSNGLALTVQQAATWRSLDPAIADVSPLAWIVPHQDGSARIVASIGALADTLTVQIGHAVYETVQSRRADDFANSIGVNIHLSYFDLVYGTQFRSIIVPRLKELGVRHLRDGGTTLPNADWMTEVYGRWRETADATGAKFTVIMSPRRTATGPGTDYTDASHIRDLVNLIGVDRIDAWEGLNENDLSGHPEFAREAQQMQRAMYQFVKADPMLASRHRVLGPSIANLGTAAQVGDLSAFMDEGVIHPYDGGQIPTANLRAHVDGIRPVTGSRTLQVTEMGYHTARTSTNPWHWPVTELAQGKYMLREFVEEFNAGITRSFAYELIDGGLDPADMEQNFGLLRNDGSRKPAFEGVRNLIALVDDRAAAPFATRALQVRVTGDTVGVHRLLLQKADGRRYLVLWRNVLSYDKVAHQDIVVAPQTVGLAFDQPVTMASVYVPLFGIAATNVYRQTRAFSVAVPDHPVVIELLN